MKELAKFNTMRTVIIGGLIVALILVGGTVWMGTSAKRDTEKAVRNVSLLYLDELVSRRSQVVEHNLTRRIEDMQIAVDLMTKNDLSDKAHFEAYQKKMKKLYHLERFAFVDTNGLIYTSTGTQSNIKDFKFDYKSIKEAEISILNEESKEKKVIIAMPVDLTFQGKKLCACFVQIDMAEMLSGLSIESDPDDVTFCNLYTVEGRALTDTILGGLAEEDNLVVAMEKATYDKGFSYEQFLDEFQNGKEGAASFTYNGIRETLSYIPIKGTNWQLTYLIRESVITESIGAISNEIILRGIIQSILTILALIAMFGFIIAQIKRNAALELESEIARAEVRGKEEELEQRVALQEKLEEQSRALSDALDAAEEANKAKTAFLSNMSHEIRTPMNAIIGLDNIALNDPQTPEKTKEYLSKINDSAEHLLGLINDILDMSRIESGRMSLRNEEFSFPKMLETINTMFSGQAADKGVAYHCHVNGELDEYYIGDNMKLRQVLINILGNAVKFTPEGGSVNLTVERKARFDGKTTVGFAIEDTGIGMSKEFLPHIFDTFAQEDSSSTNKYGSTGLGMAITKNIVEMMNGTIDVESEKGKGTRFDVTVTLEDSHREKGEGVDEIHPEEMTVLIVDDDPIACEHARLILGKEGIASEIAQSGQEAIEMVRVRHARRDPYNLMLVDWKMPDMDGVETTRRIREIVGHESAIIILTAYRWDDILEEAVEAGVDSFIPKPLFARGHRRVQISAQTQGHLGFRRGGQQGRSDRPKDPAGRRCAGQCGDHEDGPRHARDQVRSCRERQDRSGYVHLP